MHRRGKWAVLSGIVLFVAGHVGLDVALETIRPDLREPEFGCRLRLFRRAVAERPDSPVVAALGSSRTQMGLAPSALGLGESAPLVFNFGKAGGGPLRQLLMLRRLLAEGTRPDRVLIEVMPAQLYDDGPAEGMVLPDELGWGDLKGVEPYCRSPSGMRGDWWAGEARGWYTVRFCVLSRVLPQILPWVACKTYVWDALDPLGWTPFPRDELTREQRDMLLEGARTQYAERLRNHHVSPVPDRALREMLELCRRENIPAALYLMPESPSFAAMYPAEVRGRVDDYVARLAREHAVPVFDARDWLREEEFADGHHMMRVGATRFSQRFGRECLGPWLATPGTGLTGRPVPFDATPPPS